MRRQSVNELTAILDNVQGAFPGNDVEIFQRRSSRVRVVAAGSDRPAMHHASEEAGTAVRLADPRLRAAGFSAVTGSGEEAARWAMERAGQSLQTVAGDAERPRYIAAQLPADEDDTESLPVVEELESSLASFIDDVSASAPPETSLRVAGGWRETGITEEILVATAGGSAVRRRTRTWSMLALRWKSGGAWFERPRFFAFRGFGEGPDPGLPQEGFDSLLYAGLDLEPPDNATLVLRPAAAAVLVRAVVMAWNRSSAAAGSPVGPAWTVLDRPGDEEGLFGGTFDDTGHPCRELLLAGGGRIEGSLDRQGHLWRASFRDPPAPGPSNLVIPDGTVSMPPSGFAISDLRIHPLEPDRWALEGLAVALEGGEPAGSGGRCVLIIEPLRFVQRCVASVGPALPSHNGVTAPALVFDGH